MHTLQSPDQRLELSVWLATQDQDARQRDGMLYYALKRDGNDLILPSTLGLIPDGAATLDGNFTLLDHRYEQDQKSWQPLYGERSTITDHYQQLTVELQETIAPQRKLTLVFRLYDQGLAWQYIVPEQSEMQTFELLEEQSLFTLPEDCLGYDTKAAQGEYVCKPIAEIGRDCERPLLIVYPDGRHIAIGEAGLDEGSRMKLRVDPRHPNTVISELSGPSMGLLPWASSWRFVLTGDSVGQLIENNDLLRNLCPPCELDDTSWIKPGKTIREMTLSTAGGKACVDFAVKHNLQYILYDGGWYGDPYDDASDPTKPYIWPFKLKQMGIPDHDGLELAEVVAYAKQHDIGVWLYVDHRHLERNLEPMLKTFRQWGACGVKFGFVNVGSQPWTQWVHEAVKLCAAYRLMVDVHDEYRPTGMQRTWPHWLNCEGIRGNEEFPSATHNVTLPFTRFLAGEADYTICYREPRLITTDAHQLAMAVVYYGPLQLVCWYGQPYEYESLPEMQFFADVPTVWDETRVILGQVGQFIAMARRSGDRWFLGCMTNEDPRTLEVPLDFLGDGSWQMTSYADASPDAALEVGNTRVAIEQREVTASDVLDCQLHGKGGYAASFDRC